MDERQLSGWLVYRNLNGEFQPFGVFQTEAKARENIGLIGAHDGWLVKEVLFIGWGFIVTGQNGPPPLKIVE